MIMNTKKSVVAQVAVEPVQVAEVSAPVLTIVKDETDEKSAEIQPSVPEVKEVPRKLTLEEMIQRVEDLTLLIERFRALAESRRKLQTFQIGADLSLQGRSKNHDKIRSQVLP